MDHEPPEKARGARTPRDLRTRNKVPTDEWVLELVDIDFGSSPDRQRQILRNIRRDIPFLLPEARRILSRHRARGRHQSSRAAITPPKRRSQDDSE